VRVADIASRWYLYTKSGGKRLNNSTHSIPVFGTSMTSDPDASPSTILCDLREEGRLSCFPDAAALF